MSTTTRAPFLGARARIYRPPIAVGQPEPTGFTTQAQRETLRQLAHAVFEEISETQTVSIGLLGSHASPKLDEMMENEWSDCLHPVQKNLLSLNSFQEVLPSNRLAKEMRQLAKEFSDYCVLVEEHLLFHLAPGWGIALIGHLAGGRKRFGACPRTETIPPSPQEIGSSTVLGGSIPGCIVLKTKTVLKMADYAEDLASNLSLNQLLLNYKKELNHHIVQANDIGFGSSSLRPLWLTNSKELNSANQFKTKRPAFPFLKAQYNFHDGGSENKNNLFGINPTVLCQHFRYLHSQFLLTPQFCPILQRIPNDRRPRLTMEFVCSKEIFDFHVQPMLESAGLPPKSVTYTQEPIETLDEYDATILCNEKSLQEIKGEFQHVLTNKTPRSTYLNPKSNTLETAMLVSFSPNDDTAEDLEKCITRLRLNHPGIDITWVVPSLQDNDNLIKKHQLRPFALPIPWLQAIKEHSSKLGQTLIEFFFQVAKQLSPLSQFRIPTFFPVGLPHYISSLFWWLSRTDFLIFLDLPSPKKEEEETATIAAALLATLCTGHKFVLRPGEKELPPEGASGLYLKTCAKLPRLNLAEDTPPIPNQRIKEEVSHSSQNLTIFSAVDSNRKIATDKGLAYIHPHPSHSLICNQNVIEVSPNLHPDLLDRSRHYANHLYTQDRWPTFFKGITILKTDLETLVSALFDIEICTHVLTNLNPQSVEGIALSEAETEFWKSLCAFHTIPWKGSTRPKATNSHSPFVQEIEVAMKRARLRFGVPPSHELSNCPQVSIIVPTFNRPHLLRRALKSIQSQTLSDFEIIVINDGTLRVEDIIQEFTESCRITLINHEENCGLPAARNSGLKIAIGKYIAYLDDDDIFLPQHLEVGTKALRESDCQVLYTNTERCTEIWKNGELIKILSDSPYTDPFSITHLFVKNPWPVLALIHERACLKQTGLQDESLTTHEDWDFNIRLGLCFKVLRIQETTAQFTTKNDGTTMTSGLTNDFVRTTTIIYERYSSLAKHLPCVLELQLQHAVGIQEPDGGTPRKTLRSIVQQWQTGPRIDALQFAQQAIQSSNAADAIALLARMLWEFGRVESARQLIRDISDDQLARIVEPAIFIQSLNACGYQSISLKYLSKLKRKNLPNQNDTMGKWYTSTLEELSQQLKEETIESLKQPPDNGARAISTMTNTGTLL